jgi:hypothetical protein
MCRVGTRHCSNVPDSVKVAYYSDTEVVVATEFDKQDPLFEFVPMRFEVQRCDISGRYVIDVRQRPSEPGQPLAGTPLP